MHPATQQAVERAKIFLKENSYPTEYKKELWEEVYRNTNCYAYAINSIVENEPFYPNSMYYPGAFAGQSMTHYYTNESIIKDVRSDLKVLGFSMFASSLEETLKRKKHKILIAIRFDNEDFHFMRQDKDGFWSHKDGWNDRPTNLTDDGEKIINPEKELDDYILVGYFKIILKKLRI